MINKSTPYILTRGADYLVFPSEKAACEYLGVARCSVASCYRRGTKCKGYTVIRGISETELYNDSRLRKIWESMHERCEYDKHPQFKYYGGRGISVCDEWALYLPFAKWAYRNGYDSNLTIDRVNTDGDYSPGNCRWVSMKAQQNNKRSNRFVEYDGNRLTISQWAERLGIGKTTIKERLNNGWSAEDALTKPVRLRTKGYRQSRNRAMQSKTTLCHTGIWMEAQKMHDLYCVILPRDPKWNPGHIPCPDFEKRNCEGCFIKDEEDRKKMYAKRRENNASD